MKRHEQDQLLNEILAGEEVSDFRRASLDQTLDAMRRGQRRRQAGRIGAATVLVLMIAGGAMFSRLRNEPARPAVGVVSNVGNPPPPSESRPPVEMINDDELFALFPDRPMALIGPPGKQQLVFLDTKGGAGDL
jgi:hypothetical protein